MGAWGAGLYSDDTTCDVRDDYVKNLKQGASDEAAWRQIVARHGDLLEIHHVACLVYFALADTAWRYGRLHDELRTCALALLEAGGDLAVWERDSPGNDARTRRRTLAALEARLREPQPAAKPVKVVPAKPKKVRSTAPVGSAFLLPLRRGQHALMLLVGYHELESSIDPAFSVLRWRGDPPVSDVAGLVASLPMLSFSSGLGPRAHVALLPGDQRKPLLARLLQLDCVMSTPVPFHPKQTVWLAVGRIADEAEAALDSLAC